MSIPAEISLTLDSEEADSVYFALLRDLEELGKAPSTFDIRVDIESIQRVLTALADALGDEWSKKRGVDHPWEEEEAEEHFWSGELDPSVDLLGD